MLTTKYIYFCSFILSSAACLGLIDAVSQIHLKIFWIFENIFS